MNGPGDENLTIHHFHLMPLLGHDLPRGRWRRWRRGPWSASCSAGRSRAADATRRRWRGTAKRIRGANRLAAEGLHWETVTLVDHASGLPVASRSYGEEGGEPAALRALRVTHRTKTSKRGEVTEEVLYAITSLPRAQAGARRLLTLHRGHWRVENSNHYSRDKTLGEDDSRMRTGHAPANNAALNNLALAIVVLRREPGETVPETLTRLTTRRERALEVILSPH